MHCEECLALNILLENNLIGKEAYIADSPDIIYKNIGIEVTSASQDPIENRLNFGKLPKENEFICGCCGGVFSLKSKHCIKRLYVYEDWVDVSDEIVGESVDDLALEIE